MKFCRYCFILLIFHQQLIFAQEVITDTITSQYYFQVIEVQGSLTQFPYPVNNIPRINILQNTSLTAEPLLQQVPGIWMQTGAPNTNRISIRGVGNREPFATSKLRIYLDEIPLTNGIGESSLEDIDPFIFQKIEIWKSPTSALWGSGLGGMIQLQPAWDDTTKLQISSQIGSFGLWNSSGAFRKSYGVRQQHQTMIHAQFARQEGYRENNNYRKNAVTWMQKYKVNEKVILQGFAHYIKLKAQIPSSIGITDYNEQPEKAAFTWAQIKGNEDYDKAFVGVSMRYLINQKLSYQSSVFTSYFDSDEVRPFNVLHERNIAFGTRQRGIYALNSVDFITFGLEYFREKYDAQTFETLADGTAGIMLTDQSDKRNHINLFTQLQMQLSRDITMVLGSGFTNANQKKRDKPFSQSAFSPTLGFSYQTPLAGVTIFTSISKGFSILPLSSALGSDGLLNENLKPEKGWSGEAGIRFLPKNRIVSGNLTGYIMRISDLFVQKRIAIDQYIGANAGRTIHNGLEIELKFQPTNKIVLQSSYALSDHRFSEFIDGENDNSGNDLTGSAPFMMYHQLSLGLTNWLNCQVTHRLVSRTPITDDNLVYGDGYQVMHAALILKAFDTPKHNLDIRFGVENIFNQKYASMFQINAIGFGNAEPRYYYAGLPRHYHCRLIYQFK